MLAEASDGYAIAYLDGTLAYVNPALLWAARLNGQAPAMCASLAHGLAAQVIQHRGAIMPRAAAAMH